MDTASSQPGSATRRETAGAPMEAHGVLEALSRLALKADALPIAAEASLLSARLEEGLFYVACIGQFKRGKSTLVNALVGAPVLPAGVVPVTSVVTVLRYGSRPRTRIRLDSGTWSEVPVSDLRLYVSEADNPGNLKGVVAAEVALPCELLSSGLCLVDTPGLGSVFEANAAATRSFIPHIDAALVVLGADPPISGDELELVGEVARTVGRFLFALNKADRIPEEERAAAARFAAEHLGQRLGRPCGPILEISALEALSSGPTRDMPRLLDALRSLAREAGSDLVRGARTRGVERLSTRLLEELDEREAALRRPQEESTRRIEALRRSVETAERAASDLSWRFTAEQERLSAFFSKTREAFLATASPEAEARLEKALSEDRGGDRDVRRRAVALARRIAQETLALWLPAAEADAERQYREAMCRFVEIANGFFDRLRSTDPSFARLAERRFEPNVGLRTARRFYFNELFELEPAQGFRQIAGWARSRAGSLAAASRDAAEYLGLLLEHNTTRLVNDLDERVLESRRLLEGEIRDRLREGLDSAMQALDRARARRSEGAGAVEGELRRIAGLGEAVRALRKSYAAG